MTMTASFRLGRVFGIEVGANWSWLIVFALVLWSLATSVFPSQDKGLSHAAYWGMAAAAAVRLLRLDPAARARPRARGAPRGGRDRGDHALAVRRGRTVAGQDAVGAGPVPDRDRRPSRVRRDRHRAASGRRARAAAEGGRRHDLLGRLHQRGRARLQLDSGAALGWRPHPPLWILGLA